MLSKLANNRRALVAACVTASCLSLGCRSSMRPLSMFARHKEPSAEALAGAGPTKTYPAPPSASVTPEAIASVAGGTAGSRNDPMSGNTATQIAGNTPKTPAFAGEDRSSGFATPASANMSAAQANGFQGTPQTASYANSGNPNAMTSGYQFGKKTFTPKTSESVAATTPTGSQFTPPSATAPSSYTAPSSFTPPALAASKTSDSTSGTNAASDAGLGSGGFMLPSDIAATVPKTTASATEAVGGWTPPSLATSNASPAASDSSVAETKTAKAISSTSETPASFTPSGGAAATTESTKSGGYMPGSTSGSSAYPGTNYAPTSTSGSFYR